MLCMTLHGGVSYLAFVCVCVCVCLSVCLSVCVCPLTKICQKIENRICRQIQDLHASFWHKREKVVCEIVQYTGTLFLPQGVEIELFFPSTGSHFQDIGRFSKLPYLAIKLSHWPKFQKLHIHSLSTSRVEISLFLLYGQRFPRDRPIFKIAIFGQCGMSRLRCGFCLCGYSWDAGVVFCGL